MMAKVSPPSPFLFTFLYMLVSSVQSNTILPSLACNYTSHPDRCLSILSTSTNSSNYYGYAYTSISYSLQQTKLSIPILRKRIGATNSNSALQVCLQMAEDNMEFLEEARIDMMIEEAEMTLEFANRLMTLMSAVIADQETCMDEIIDYGDEESYYKLDTWGVERDAYEHMKNLSKAHVVSLELLVKALEGKTKAIYEDVRGYDLEAWKKDLGGDAEGRTEEEMLDKYTVVVSKDGKGNFTTVQDAVDYATNISLSGDHRRFIIHVREGRYYENVTVSKKRKNLTMIGDGINRTLLIADHNAVDKKRTFYTATFTVEGSGFIGINLTFVNSAGPEKDQAVAVRNSANHSVFYQCSFHGYQDTLYAHRNIQFYRDCDIYGTVDFIFGYAAAIFQNCTIYAHSREQNQMNTITAQGRSMPGQRSGFSIHNSTILAAPDLELNPNSTRTYLGRPWKDYATTVFMQCRMDALIDGAGWLDWDGRGESSSVFCGEYGNYGLGSNTSARVQWKGWKVMNVSEALEFTVDKFWNGEKWLPHTLVPFLPGLADGSRS